MLSSGPVPYFELIAVTLVLVVIPPIVVGLFYFMLVSGSPQDVLAHHGSRRGRRGWARSESLRS